jgi:adenine phosphoribosyltransferase
MELRVPTADMDLKALIRPVPDYPKPGILFYDITTLLRHPVGFHSVVSQMCEPFAGGGVDIVVGIESRGFILGGAVAERLGAGFVPVRKPGKLPSATRREAYTLEYGSNELEIHTDALTSGQRVLIVDDVPATGGTAAAAVALVRALGARLEALSFLIELDFLDGKSRLPGERVHSVLHY